MKYASATPNCTVTKVIVKWNPLELLFEVEYESITSLDSVRGELSKVIKLAEERVAKHRARPQKFHSIALSEDELRQFGDGAMQVHSDQAVLLVRNDSHFFKLHFDPIISIKFNVHVKPEWSLFLFPTAKKYIAQQEFLQYPALETHLSMDEAALCLSALVPSVISAIESLHHATYAHLDIRLPNICFKEDGTAVLIDLDRWKKSSTKANSVLNRSSVMYHYGKQKVSSNCSEPPRFPDYWTVQNIDFRQLGIMIQGILYPCSDDHAMNLTSISNQYVKELIEKDSSERISLDEFRRR